MGLDQMQLDELAIRPNGFRPNGNVPPTPGRNLPPGQGSGNFRNEGIDPGEIPPHDCIMSIFSNSLVNRITWYVSACNLFASS